MTNPLHARHYADQALCCEAEIVGHQQLARDTFWLRLSCAELAARIVPGQFVMLRLAGFDDPLIGRPLALYDVWHDAADSPAGIDLVYLVKGKLTTRLARLAATQTVSVWGPLGNGFAPRGEEHLVMVAGGIGQTPFLALAKERLGRQNYGRQSGRAGRITFCYGARSADLLAGVDHFAACGIDVRLCTDDGTQGRRGLVTDELQELLEQDGGAGAHVVCCGPEPMMEAVAELAARFQVTCEVSLETPMACGIGICFTCVAKIRQNGGWDYKRTCVEGPVFPAEQIVW